MNVNTENFRNTDNQDTSVEPEQESLSGQLLLSDLDKLWRLGKNIILSWCYTDDGLSLLVVPFYYPAGIINKNQTQNRNQYELKKPTHDSIESAFYRLITGSRQLDYSSLMNMADRLKVKPVNIYLPDWGKANRLDQDQIDEIIRRYSISLITDRAVILFDISGFSLASAFEQMVMINSLSYSINSAYEKIIDKNIQVDFARTTTGDGFYVWNRQEGLQANLNLYHLMHIILADNAIARRKSGSTYVPKIKTAFHIGDCFEFYQTAGLSQTMHTYIVGDVTIELARLIEHARPGQILVGDFQTGFTNSGSGENETTIDSVRFIEAVQPTLDKLRDVELAGDRIDHIKCYLTGQRQADNSFDINMLRLVDKHNRRHFAYNAKINFHRKEATPIFLGIQEKYLVSVYASHGPGKRKNTLPGIST